MVKKAPIGLLITVFITLCVSREQPDVVAGNLIQFNDNGTRDLYQPDGVMVDPLTGTFLVGSVACSLGVDGATRAGDIDVVRYDLGTGGFERIVLRSGSADSLSCDNRHAPALSANPNGDYLALYAPSFLSNIICYREYSGESWKTWSDEKQFDRTAETGSDQNPVSVVSNLLHLSHEQRFYCFVRNQDGSHHFLVRQDTGSGWAYGGKLLARSSTAVPGWVYCRFSGNGSDRIDLIVSGQETEGSEDNPDIHLDVYHGFIRDGSLHRSDGTVIDESLSDTATAASPEQLTCILPDNYKPEGAVWCTDLQTYPGDTVAAAVTRQVVVETADGPYATQVLYCLLSGREWKTGPVARSGIKHSVMIAGFTGNTAALDPDDRNSLYMSAITDPRDNAPLGVHELFHGTTGDEGNTWTWQPVTSRSSRDNLYPVVPSWNGRRTALLWMRGSVHAANHADAALVGMIMREGETLGPKVYTDASRKNCLISCGVDSLDFSYNETGHGLDNRWHELPGFGNNETVIVSSQNPEWEDAMLIKQSVFLEEPGTYDFWADFWAKADTAANWLIATGLAPTVQMYRQMACRTVDTGDYDTAPLVTMGDSLFLYQAYAGRATVTDESGELVSVYIDDHALMTGSYFGLSGDNCRTWFDGISHARIVTPAGTVKPSGKPLSRSAAGILNARYLPSRSQVRITCSIRDNNHAVIALYDLQGKRIALYKRYPEKNGVRSVTIPAHQLHPGMYLCRLTAGGGTGTRAVTITR